MEMKYLHHANRILLGLLFLVPGLMKLFVMGPSAVVGMLDGLGFPIAGFLAWVLIVVEIVCGAMIIFNYQLKYAVWGPSIILLVAAFTTHLGDWIRIIMHLALITNLILWTHDHKKK